MCLVEELDRQNRRQAAENIEVVPLDGIADRGGNDHGPEILRDLDCHGYAPLPSWLSASAGAAMLTSNLPKRKRPSRLTQFPNALYDLRVGQRRDIARILLVRDRGQNAPHDLARAGLRHVGHDDDAPGSCDRADL